MGRKFSLLRYTFVTKKNYPNWITKHAIVILPFFGSHLKWEAPKPCFLLFISWVILTSDNKMINAAKNYFTVKF